MKDFAVKGKKALKLVKTKPELNASWKGFKVSLNKPTKTIKLGDNSKNEAVNGAKLYCLDFKIHFQGGTHEWYFKGLKFKQGTHVWKNVEQVVTFKKSIVAVTPTLLFYRGIGTVWFDNIYAKPIYDDQESNNILLNGDIEDEGKIKDVYTLKFRDQVWAYINTNANKMINYIGKQNKSKTNFYLLVPPVYNSELKNGYQQEFEVNKFKENLSKQCKLYKIKYLDTSNLLDENHYTEFESGEKKGLVEPLHFNTKGHTILAKYLK